MGKKSVKELKNELFSGTVIGFVDLELSASDASTKKVEAKAAAINARVTAKVEARKVQRQAEQQAEQQASAGGDKSTNIQFTGDAVVDFIKKQEGFMPNAYKDATGYSIGYGHFIKPNEKHLQNATLSEADATALLKKDIKEHQDPWMNRLKVPITDGQKIALTSLAFNIGPYGGKSGKGGVFGIVDLINDGKMQQAADRFLLFDKYRTQKDGPLMTNEALSRRRKTERGLFLGKLDPKSTKLKV